MGWDGKTRVSSSSLVPIRGTRTIPVKALLLMLTFVPDCNNDEAYLDLLLSAGCAPRKQRSASKQFGEGGQLITRFSPLLHRKPEEAVTEPSSLMLQFYVYVCWVKFAQFEYGRPGRQIGVEFQPNGMVNCNVGL